MTNFSNFYQQIATNRLSHWLNTLPAQLDHWQKNELHGEFKHWQKTLEALPNGQSNNVDLTTSVTVGSKGDLNPGEEKRLENLMKKFKPWRKGPYHIHGLHIDTEWRSDFKWDRLAEHIGDLSGKYVLDIGCGSGYHLWRMRGAGAKFVVGVDPTQLFLMQFNAVQHFIQDKAVNLLPLGVEQLPELKSFDTVFAMGVLYHRRSPIDFLYQLKSQLVKGGELVLETLIVDGDENTVLVPGERYAKMRNVWFLPSAKAMCAWLERCGFSNIRVVNTDITALDEQRKTEWIDTESLSDFLDPEDNSKTIEGYPAPQRAIFIANA
ncbi:tRNA 5-methoxyuridine(34)/uridine 5-oxyacetic acid(34) synthase CmoB [Colwellia sp. 4_MG-2023]|jgi:tRNA (mo5U34)-methyltransferase|uniref:tRNA 5-methoxyuridine(34)/uridine 5-oxyacetic acid(34) synthase CmoB n=1 Tax=unclassified Colwellia TaxID=196834 RepID=UPI001C08066F|nr:MULTISPECIES: tRNA 5-methoxyuridine(34)/uridine 5-oxyacetic acid(34) synthase CmoB [unclassified Colwellia]MBU2925724.1 tRNA 5-methoxyuridine(34)/uridine 5-oxyacetic acid(34) synthase CmoB [Colwellia sp. C2M11]MDO6487793.1 tRNA 5-methoxyuridine(34)/uridine 5-oxyacetic acid(34) synthase CmoB [Colwellia sp. 6_MG-2023]MDO6505626.1 tRNA 5-methoxyuridine(34)/uridine 5-oxyacetic acid(34) synthase CmoB [Colwellia sp. 5_MG-2023]MDO6554078.1 tRNA 5-methoxyuridine(34)/uridine 5-oxyacetic acid(34) synt